MLPISILQPAGLLKMISCIPLDFSSLCSSEPFRAISPLLVSLMLLSTVSAQTRDERQFQAAKAAFDSSKHDDSVALRP
jgi:hypothetical protein